MVFFLKVLFALIGLATIILAYKSHERQEKWWHPVAILLSGYALMAGPLYAWHQVEKTEALARPSMDIRACKPGDQLSCTTATDVVSMTPQPDGTLYVEFRDGGWMTGAFIEADESDITITNVRCNGSSTTKAVSDGTPVTMTLCSSNYTFGSR